MKRQGETEANPRFQQLNIQLMAIQRAQAIKTQQAQQLSSIISIINSSSSSSSRPTAASTTATSRQSRLLDSQSSPVMTVPQRPQENGQINGISPLRYKTKCSGAQSKDGCVLRHLLLNNYIF